MDTLFTNQNNILTDHVAAREDITLNVSCKEINITALDTLELDATDLLAAFDADMFYCMEETNVDANDQQENKDKENETSRDKRKKRKRGLLKGIGIGQHSESERGTRSPSQASIHSDNENQEEDSQTP